MLVQTWGDVLIASFQVLWGGVVAFVPKLIVALVVFIIGWVIAVALGKVVVQMMRSLKVDMALRSLGMEEAVSRAGMKLDSGAFVGGLVRWFFILVFLLAAVDVLGLSQVTEFLRSVVLAYIPQVIVASVGDVGSEILPFQWAKTEPRLANVAARKVAPPRIFPAGDIYQRPTPRAVDALEELAKYLHPELF